MKTFQFPAARGSAGATDDSMMPPVVSRRAEEAIGTLARLVGRQMARDQFEHEQRKRCCHLFAALNHIQDWL
jgi:hypothetical protein